MDLLAQLTEEFHLRPGQVENAVKLIDDGNTIPFIARYRKEMTGSLDDQVLRELSERLAYLRGLEKRKEEVRSAIEEQGKLTPELELSLIHILFKQLEGMPPSAYRAWLNAKSNQ